MTSGAESALSLKSIIKRTIIIVKIWMKRYLSFERWLQVNDRSLG